MESTSRQTEDSIHGEKSLTKNKREMSKEQMGPGLGARKPEKREAHNQKERK